MGNTVKRGEANTIFEKGICKKQNNIICVKQRTNRSWRSVKEPTLPSRRYNVHSNGIYLRGSTSPFV